MIFSGLIAFLNQWVCEQTKLLNLKRYQSMMKSKTIQCIPKKSLFDFFVNNVDQALSMTMINFAQKCHVASIIYLTLYATQLMPHQIFCTNDLRVYITLHIIITLQSGLLTTTYVVCVNFYLCISDWIYSLKSTPNDTFYLRNFSWYFFFIFSQSFCQKCAERKSPKKYFSCFVLMSGLGLESWLFV